MGKAFKCDLCGRLSEGEPTKEVDAPLGKGLRMVASLRVEDSPLDLCSDCALSLSEALVKAFASLPEEIRKKLDFEVEEILRKLHG